jgi:hypothetical protein
MPEMRIAMIAGIVLVILGAMGLYFRGVPYTKKEEVFRVGGIKAQVESREVFEVHPAISGMVLAGGVALVALAFRRKS